MLQHTSTPLRHRALSLYASVCTLRVVCNVCSKFYTDLKFEVDIMGRIFEYSFCMTRNFHYHLIENAEHFKPCVHNECAYLHQIHNALFCDNTYITPLIFKTHFLMLQLRLLFL